MEKVIRAVQIAGAVGITSFVILYGLGKGMLGAAVVILTIVLCICLTAFGLMYEKRREKHSVPRICLEYNSLAGKDIRSDKAREYLEAELAFSKKNKSFSHNAEFISVILAGHYANLGMTEKAFEYIEAVSPEKLGSYNDSVITESYYSVFMDICLSGNDISRARRIYESFEKQFPEILLEDRLSVHILKAKYRLAIGDFEGVLKETEAVSCGSFYERLSIFQWRVNALINLKRLDEAEELVRDIRQEEECDSFSEDIDRIEEMIGAQRDKAKAVSNL